MGKVFQEAFMTTATEVKKLKPADYFEVVERRANELFLERIDRAAEGNYISDWSRAEKEIKSKYHL